MKREGLTRPGRANLSVQVRLNAGPNELPAAFPKQVSETNV